MGCLPGMWLVGEGVMDGRMVGRFFGGGQEIGFDCSENGVALLEQAGRSSLCSTSLRS
jgi:hypothetical protein